MLKFFMSRRFSVFSFLFLLLTSYFLFLASPVHAQTSDPVSADQPSLIEEKQDAMKEGGNQEAWLEESMGSNTVSAIKALVGEIPKDVLHGIVPKKINYVPGGVMGMTTRLTAALYGPAMGVSGIQYIANLKESFLGAPAYAQGVGFVGLQPILPIWRGFRNFTYLFASFIFVLIGIMIMLRVKISNQAVISIQSAVPQIITTLVLITFSYAIAGLVIDFMQFIQSFVIALLFNVTGKSLGSSLLSPGWGLSSLHNYSFSGLSNADMNTVAGLTERAIPMGPIIAWVMIIGAVIATFFTFVAGASFVGIASAVLLLVLLICMLVWMFKFYFGCLKCYVTAIFKIIIGPLEIAMGAFPNSKMGFNSWIWDIIANLSVFPISIIFLVMANIIIDAADNGGLWAPAIISGPSLQSAVVGGLSLTQVVSIGIGLSTVALMSKLPEMIPQFIFMIKPTPWEQAVGQGLNPKWLQQGGQMAVGAGATWGYRRLTTAGPRSPAPISDPTAQAVLAGVAKNLGGNTT